MAFARQRVARAAADPAAPRARDAASGPPPPTAAPRPARWPRHPHAPVDDRLAKQQAQIDALVARSKDQEAQVAALQGAGGDAPRTTPRRFSRLLSFWGFSDLSFGGIDFDNDHALYKVQTPSKLTFFSSGINLYAKSEMTRTLSALVETRLTYSPNGYAADWPAQINVGSTTIQSAGQLRRASTRRREGRTRSSSTGRTASSSSARTWSGSPPTGSACASGGS